MVYMLKASSSINQLKTVTTLMLFKVPSIRQIPKSAPSNYSIPISSFYTQDRINTSLKAKTTISRLKSKRATALMTIQGPANYFHPPVS